MEGQKRESGEFEKDSGGPLTECHRWGFWNGMHC